MSDLTPPPPPFTEPTADLPGPPPPPPPADPSWTTPPPAGDLAASATVLPPFTTQPETIRRTSRGTGVLFGLGAGLVGGLAWYLIVAGSKRQFVYGALILGLFIGWAVVKGAASAGPVSAAIAAAIALGTVVVAYYYIDRYLLVTAAEDQGVRLSIPLLPSPSEFKEVLRIGYREEKAQYMFSAIAVVAAGAIGFTGGRGAARPRRR